MGYCVEMEINNCYIREEHYKDVIDVLNKLNEKWHRTNDWCRFNVNPSDFDSDQELLVEIFDDIGFSTHTDNHGIGIEDYEREKLGSHEDMFESLAPYFMYDCEIKIFGEDQEDWKLVIKDKKFRKVYRESL